MIVRLGNSYNYGNGEVANFYRSAPRLHPLSAVVELRWTETMSRDAWQIRIETEMRLSCTRDGFLLQGSLRAWEGANEVCRRERDIPRDFL